jgi:hypothetical protein
MAHNKMPGMQTHVLSDLELLCTLPQVLSTTCPAVFTGAAA